MKRLSPLDWVAVLWVLAIAVFLAAAITLSEWVDNNDREAWCKVESPGPCVEIEGRGTCKLIQGNHYHASNGTQDHLYLCWEGK